MLLSEYSLSWQPEKAVKEKRDSFPALWVLCDTKDLEHNVMLGTHVSTHNEHTHYLVANVTMQGKTCHLIGSVIQCSHNTK